MLTAHADGLGHLALLRIELGGGQEIGHPDDRVHRRSDLVAHVGQEVRLCLRRGLRHDLGAGEIGLRALALDELPNLTADTLEEAQYGFLGSALFRAEELHHPQETGRTDDREAERAMQVGGLRRGGARKVGVVHDIDDPRRPLGAPHAARQPDPPPEAELPAQVRQLMRFQLGRLPDLLASQDILVEIDPPADPENPAQTLADSLEHAGHGLGQRLGFHEDERGLMLRRRIVLARAPDLVRDGQ